MTKAINKMLAVVLSFAMVITGFTFLGGAVSVNAETQTDTITIKVVDQNGNGVSGVYLLCTDEDNNDISYGTTNDEGIATHKIDKSQEYYEEDAKYDVTAENCEVTSPVVFTISEFQSGENTGMFFNTVNGEPYYEDDIAELVIKTEEPQPTGFEITFDPGEGASIAEGEATATTGADGKLTSLPVPTVKDEELVFAGWFMFGPDGEEEIDVTTDTVFTSDAIVFARYESVWEWQTTDFVYGDWQTTSHSDSDYEPVYPGNENELYLTDKLRIVTGFSEKGLQKVKVNRDLIIPSEDNEGNEIQGIGKNAFSGSSSGPLKNTKLKSVILPEGVYTSDNVYNNDSWKPYANDQNLEKRGNFVIGYSAFDGNEIEYVSIPEGVLSIGTYAFRNNMLTDVEFPSTLMVIGSGAFAGNSAKQLNQISNISFAKETDFRLSIRVMAFSQCAVREVTLPKDTLQVFMNASNKSCAFTMNPGMEEVTDPSANATEKRGGVVYMYMEQTPGVDTSLIAHTENDGLKSCNQKLITDSTIIEVKRAVQEAEEALGEAYEAQSEIENADDKEAAIANSEAKSEAAVNAAESARKAAEEAKKEYEEDSEEANLLEGAAYDARYAGMYANQVLAQAKSTAAQAASAKAAAMAPGNAAVAAAQVAVDKANEAKAAAEKVVAEMKELGFGDEDAPEEMKQELADAEEAARNAVTAANNANKALDNAKAAVTAASDAAAEAARQGTPDPSLPKVKISKPKAAKGAVTAKWKKLTKKNQKKAAKIEVWVCPDRNFAVTNTKGKVVSKKKASVKVKGLSKKTTYFVKVRTIKDVNGVRYVGPWSKVKKIKTK